MVFEVSVFIVYSIERHKLLGALASVHLYYVRN